MEKRIVHGDPRPMTADDWRKWEAEWKAEEKRAASNPKMTERQWAGVALALCFVVLIFNPAAGVIFGSMAFWWLLTAKN